MDLVEGGVHRVAGRERVDPVRLEPVAPRGVEAGGGEVLAHVTVVPVDVVLEPDLRRGPAEHEVGVIECGEVDRPLEGAAHEGGEPHFTKPLREGDRAGLDRLLEPGERLRGIAADSVQCEPRVHRGGGGSDRRAELEAARRVVAVHRKDVAEVGLIPAVEFVGCEPLRRLAEHEVDVLGHGASWSRAGEIRGYGITYVLVYDRC